MQPEERNQFAERWLDQALAHYSDAEPRPGLESRILANLTAAKATRWPVWRRFAIAGVCAAVVCLTLGLALLRRPVGPPNGRVSAISPAPSPGTSVNSATAQIAHVTADTPTFQHVSERCNTKNTKRPAQTSMAGSKEPRQPQFPAAMPLSGQQTLVIAYIRSTPTEELMRVSAEQREWQQRVESGAKATQAENTPAQTEINRLNFPPIESGSSQSGKAR